MQMHNEINYLEKCDRVYVPVIAVVSNYYWLHAQRVRARWSNAVTHTHSLRVNFKQTKDGKRMNTSRYISNTQTGSAETVSWILLSLRSDERNHSVVRKHIKTNANESYEHSQYEI